MIKFGAPAFRETARTPPRTGAKKKKNTNQLVLSDKEETKQFYWHEHRTENTPTSYRVQKFRFFFLGGGTYLHFYLFI
jgi:hypothetical protein